MNAPAHFRLGTRGSPLALAQSGLVARAIERANPGTAIELIVVKTTGDRVQDRPLHELGGKGLFTKELELALLAGSIDFAVHSYKDVPVTMPLVDQSDLIVAAVPEREDARDALASVLARSLDDLPAGARVGTGSLRRRSQLLDRRADLVIEPIRGNIDTRLRKLAGGEFDAIILAAAGARRAGLWDDSIMASLEPEIMLPAAGQGALALQCRRSNERVAALLATIHHSPSARCVAAERGVVFALNGDCHSPIAAFATILPESDALHLRVAVGLTDGSPPVTRQSATRAVDAEAIEAALHCIRAFEPKVGHGVR